MVNFLEETMEFVNAAGMEPIFIGLANTNVTMTWATFQKRANFLYDDGYGTNEIPLDLIIGFPDGSFLKRGEYDGSEWWEYIEPFKMPENCLIVEDTLRLF